jgi:hypothetical protein
MTKIPGQLPQNLPFPELPGLIGPEEKEKYRNTIKQRLIKENAVLIAHYYTDNEGTVSGRGNRWFCGRFT